MTTIRNGCLLCHGAMGKRQFDTDSGGSGDFQLDWLQVTDRSDPHFKYGALARDGISCAACHRSVPTETPPGTTPLEYFLQNSITGHFQVDTPDKIFGPVPGQRHRALRDGRTRRESSRNSTPTSSPRGCAAVATRLTCRWPTGSPDSVRSSK